MATRPQLVRPMLLGVLAAALAFGALEGIRKCDVTPPCPQRGIDPVSGLQIVCSTVGVIGPCPVGSLNGLGSAAVGGAVGMWAYLRRGSPQPRV